MPSVPITNEVFMENVTYKALLYLLAIIRAFGLLNLSGLLAGGFIVALNKRRWPRSTAPLLQSADGYAS